MSIKDRIAARQKSNGVFICVAGERLSGKSTIAATLPGKTLLLQASVLETGSNSATKLAKQLKNKLDVVDFTSLDDLVALLDEARKSDYNNIFIDGISAVTEMKLGQPDVQAVLKRDQWGAYRIIGEAVRNFLKMAKSIASEDGKVVAISLALQPKRDANGNLTELVPSVKGNVAISEISRLAPIFVTLRMAYDEEGNSIREMVTKTDSVYPGRIDSLLDNNNPGVLDADLSVLLKLIAE